MYWSKLKKRRSNLLEMQIGWRYSLLLAIVISNTACTHLAYYAQATQGQLDVIRSARPIDTWLADPGISKDLKQRLARTREIRQFASRELGLPDNGSYTRYADIKRPFVVWNVVATPELSMKPVQWCFPVAGCVDYRGYYNKQHAQRFAAELRAEGYEARVAGVPAYSTLGWFDDPVLSTFIVYPEAEVARMLFHELAHQVAYAPGDTPFNEAFATTVEGIGVTRWLDIHASEETRHHYQQFRARKQDFIKLLSTYRLQLEAVFASEVSDDDKREQKAALIAALQQDYQQIKQNKWQGYAGYDVWFNEPITNAHFVSIATYEALVPAFQSLFAQSGSLPKFYAEVKALAKQDKVKRQQRLAALMMSPTDSCAPRQTEAMAITPPAAAQ